MLYFNLELINKPNVLLVSGFGLWTLEEKQVKSPHSPQLKGKTKMLLLYIERPLVKNGAFSNNSSVHNLSFTLTLPQELQNYTGWVDLVWKKRGGGRLGRLLLTSDSRYFFASLIWEIQPLVPRMPSTVLSPARMLSHCPAFRRQAVFVGVGWEVDI